MIFMYLFIIRIYVSPIILTDLFSSEILGICYQGTGHHLCMGGGGREKEGGRGVKATSDWLEQGLNFFIKKFRGGNSLIARHIFRGVNWPRWLKQLNSRAQTINIP